LSREILSDIPIDDLKSIKKNLKNKKGWEKKNTQEIRKGKTSVLKNVFYNDRCIAGKIDYHQGSQGEFTVNT
jgi:hypothetical protein